MNRTAIAVAIAATLTGYAHAQTVLTTPSHGYYGGIVMSDDYRKGTIAAVANKQTTMHRWEQDVGIEANAQFINANHQTMCHTQADTSYCYNQMTLMNGVGPGLINADYMRTEHAGTGPAIARKTAVRGHPQQWANWAHQINMGPGAKAALWIGGDNPQLEGRAYDTVPNVIVVNNNLKVTGSVFQWNATPDSQGVFLRVFKGQKLVYEVTSDGIVRARGFQVIP